MMALPSSSVPPTNVLSLKNSAAKVLQSDSLKDPWWRNFRPCHFVLNSSASSDPISSSNRAQNPENSMSGFPNRAVSKSACDPESKDCRKMLNICFSVMLGMLACTSSRNCKNLRRHSGQSALCPLNAPGPFAKIKAEICGGTNVIPTDSMLGLAVTALISTDFPLANTGAVPTAGGAKMGIPALLRLRSIFGRDRTWVFCARGFGPSLPACCR